MSITRLTAVALFALAAAPALTAIPAAAQPYPPPTYTPPGALPPPPGALPPPVARPMTPPPGALYKRPENEIGTGQSLPLSNQSSNITPGDTRSTIAPRLPSPVISENAPPAAFLQAARAALAAGQTGAAQEALERAETRTLDRAVRPSRANAPSCQPLVSQIAEARGALSTGDRARAIQIIDAALRNPEAGRREMN